MIVRFEGNIRFYLLTYGKGIESNPVGSKFVINERPKSRHIAEFVSKARLGLSWKFLTLWARLCAGKICRCCILAVLTSLVECRAGKAK
jgi:hypothetical protein